MDVLQSLSGLLLVLFVWAHMFFESSILLGKDAMLWVTRMFEGEHLLGEPYPILVSAVGAGMTASMSTSVNSAIFSRISGETS